VIIGVGVDAVDIARVRTALTRTPSLQARLYTEAERASCTSRCGDLRFGGLAARFAAKEAVAKALGTGIRGFGFRDVEIRNDELGKPIVVLHGGAAEAAARAGVERVHLSLTHTDDVAIAHAVAESGGD
jgi:holo-[acyl-carrier protein] synthase